MIDMKKIGMNIRMERKRQHMTIEHLSEKAGITENFLGKIERGQGIPSFPTIDSIASALNVSIDFLKGADNYDCAEYKLIKSVMEINQLSCSKREQFIDFINTNIKYFKDD